MIKTYIFVNTVIIMFFIIYIKYYKIICLNNIYNKNAFNYDINIYYKLLLREAYKRKPNIEKQLNYIKLCWLNLTMNQFFLLDGIRIYAKSMRILNISNKLRFNDGDIGMFYFQMKHYNQLLSKFDKEKYINNICEIGFQLGVGAITLITSVKHKTNYYGFDFGNIYSKKAFSIVSKYFSMDMIWGDSKITIPKFYRTNYTFNKCDIIHIDGCHSQTAVLRDIINMKKISNSKSLVLLDDVYYDSNAIKEAVKKNLLNNVLCFIKPYCIAYYI